jgi:nucleotide-binding universal stress UspA family protein
MRMKTILAPVDFSFVTARVIDAAITLARPCNARVVLLHVEPVPSAIRNLMPAVEDVKMRTASVGRVAEKKLLDLSRTARRRWKPVEFAHLSGTPATRIVDEARRTKATYIVMGSHGRSAMRDALVGSVAATVIRTAPCPVLVVPPARAMSLPGPGT